MTLLNALNRTSPKRERQVAEQRHAIASDFSPRYTSPRLKESRRDSRWRVLSMHLSPLRGFVSLVAFFPRVETRGYRMSSRPRLGSRTGEAASPKSNRVGASALFRSWTDLVSGSDHRAVDLVDGAAFDSERQGASRRLVVLVPAASALRLTQSTDDFRYEAGGAR